MSVRTHAASNRDTQDKFQHSAGCVKDAFHDTLGALEDLHPEHVYSPPDITAETISKQLKFKEFENCRGEIDGTHIPIIVADEK